MAIRFELAEGEEAGLAFAASPLLETVLSLHVLAEPKHHALQHEWVRSMRALPAALRREIAALSFLYRWTLKLVAERPRSTQEIASLVAVSEAAASKSLRLLASAGLLRSRREGYYVVYSLASDELAALSRELRSLGGG